MTEIVQSGGLAPHDDRFQLGQAFGAFIMNTYAKGHEYNFEKFKLDRLLYYE